MKTIGAWSLVGAGVLSVFFGRAVWQNIEEQDSLKATQRLDLPTDKRVRPLYRIVKDAALYDALGGKQLAEPGLQKESCVAGVLDGKGKQEGDRAQYRVLAHDGKRQITAYIYKYSIQDNGKAQQLADCKAVFINAPPPRVKLPEAGPNYAEVTSTVNLRKNPNRDTTPWGTIEGKSCVVLDGSRKDGMAKVRLHSSQGAEGKAPYFWIIQTALKPVSRPSAAECVAEITKGPEDRKYWARVDTLPGAAINKKSWTPPAQPRATQQSLIDARPAEPALPEPAPVVVPASPNPSGAPAMSLYADKYLGKTFAGLGKDNRESAAHAMPACKAMSFECQPVMDVPAGRDACILSVPVQNGKEPFAHLLYALDQSDRRAKLDDFRNGNPLARGAIPFNQAVMVDCNNESLLREVKSHLDLRHVPPMLTERTAARKPEPKR